MSGTAIALWVLVVFIVVIGAVLGTFYLTKDWAYANGYTASDKVWQEKYAIELPKKYDEGYKTSEAKWQAKYAIDQQMWVEQGRRQGDNEGYQRGKNDGYNEGRNQGYNEGYLRGLQERQYSTYTQSCSYVWNCWYQWYLTNKQANWPAYPTQCQCPSYPYRWLP